MFGSPCGRTRALFPVGGTLPDAWRPLVGGRGDHVGLRVSAWLVPQGAHGCDRRLALPSAHCSSRVEGWPLPDSWCLGQFRRKGAHAHAGPHTPPRVWVGARPLPVAWWASPWWEGHGRRSPGTLGLSLWPSPLLALAGLGGLRWEPSSCFNCARDVIVLTDVCNCWRDVIVEICGPDRR